MMVTDNDGYFMGNGEQPGAQGHINVLVGFWVIIGTSYQVIPLRALVGFETSIAYKY